MICIPRPSKIYWIVQSIALIAIMSVTVGCRIPTFVNPKAMQIQKLTISGPKFTLAWDDDSPSKNLYNVYSRPHNTSSWDTLAAGLESPSLVITSGQLTYGEYDFAVCSISIDGSESPQLTSLAPSAIPTTGWYLLWTP